MLARLDVHVRVGEFAKINLRTGHVQALYRALHGHVAQQQRGQPLRCEAVDRVHGDAVAVGVDQLLVDPVAAALGQLLDVQLARRQHHLAQGAVEVVAVDVDVGKVVVGADLLLLAQGVLQGVPVPQADVLQRGLIVGGVGGIDRGLGGKLTLLELVEPVCLLGELDVVGDVGGLAHQLVGLDDEVADVPAHHAHREIAEHGWNHGGDKQLRSRAAQRVEQRDARAEEKRQADDQQSGDGHMRVGVVDALEDGVMVQQALEAADDRRSSRPPAAGRRRRWRARASRNGVAWPRACR